MNKKLAALLIPLLLLPIAGFGYATWSDTVTKTYSLTAGTVDIGVVPVDYLSENEDLVGLDVDWEFCTDEVVITATNMYPCWGIEMIMLIHNKGTLPVDVDYEISAEWNGIDLTFTTVEDVTGFYYDFEEDGLTYPEDIVFEYIDEWYFWVEDTDDDEYPDPEECEPITLPYYWLEPCEYILKYESLHFAAQERQDELQGESFTIVITVTAEQAVP